MHSLCISYCTVPSPPPPPPLSLSLLHVSPLSPHLQTVRAFLPWMLDSNYGYIVNIASVAAFGGYPYSADYSASKAAVLNFSEALRSELIATGRSGISVTCVCPLLINTRMVWESRALKKGHSEPTMEPHYVARRILTAMADKQFLLALPTILHLARFLKR